MADPFIVKVQRPLMTNMPGAPLLVYNEDRSVDRMFSADEFPNPPWQEW